MKTMWDTLEVLTATGLVLVIADGVRSLLQHMG
jgi:hypothetical protein